MPVFDAAGPGRKQCPGCQKFCGVRSNTCPGCAYAFPKSKPLHERPEYREPLVPEDRDDGNAPVPERKQRQDSPQAKPESRDHRIVVVAPAGYPPVELLGSDEATVEAWGQACRDANPNLILSWEALAYWARYKYPYEKTETWNQVRDILKAKFEDNN